MRWLLSLLSTPSSFPADPWGYARNQIGHGYLIGGLGALLVGILPILILYLAWEAVQYLRFGGTLSDGLEDFANVLAVALAAALWRPEIILIHTVYLAAEFSARMEISKGGRNG